MNQMPSHQGLITDGELVDVEIETFDFSRYSLPKVPFKILWPILKSDNLHGFPSLSIQNQHGAVLIIETRIIRYILIDGQVFWEARR